MKHLKLNSLIILLALLISLNSCGKDDPVNPGSDNKFFAKVDGQDYNPGFVTGLVSGFTQTLLITGSMGDGEEIQLQIPAAVTPGTYVLDFNLANSYYAYYQRSDVDEDYGFSDGGTLTIISNDVAGKKIKGSFSFNTDPFLSDGSTFQITEGSFEITYTEI